MKAAVKKSPLKFKKPSVRKPSVRKPSAKEPIRVAVLESDPLRFVGLRTLFGSQAEFRIRSTTVPLILKTLDDDVVLMTTSRGSIFYSAMSALKAVRPSVRILVTGAGSRDEDILRAIGAGAKGYIPEDADPADFKQAIRTLHSGSVWAPGRVLGTFIERVTASTSVRQVPPEGGQMLSHRQRQVLGLLAVGNSNKEIARELGLTERTVKAHVAGLLRKIGAPNRIALSVHPLTHTLLAVGR
ncbi:MAG TPA: response regulator transcription factor [Terriglobales bacterium]|nr:response regulator transcription factor [Terriglobales bacterium]